MKKKMKILAVALTVLLLVSAGTAIVFAVDGESGGETPAVGSLKIQNFSLSLENNVFMNFKVSSENVTNVSDIKILAWNEAPAEYKKGTEALCLDSMGTEGGTGYEFFQYTDLAAKDMTKTVYVCAYLNADGVEIYSNPAKFSIAMYAYLKKNAASPDEDLVKMLDAMLAYGAAAQVYFDHNTDFYANATMYQIDVVNGTLEDGFAKGWYQQNGSFTLTANAPESGYRFSHWENSAGENVGDTETLTLEATATEKYTAVYEEAVTYSQGLTYSDNGDGTLTVTGIGTCTDTDLRIPPEHEGKRVTKIGIGAFDYSYKKITGVVIPNSVTSIGSSAFEGCHCLVNVVIPDSVTSIGADAFYECFKLVEVINHSSLNITPGNTNYGYVARYAFEVHSEKSRIENINGYRFYSCSEGENPFLYYGKNYLIDYVGNEINIVLPDDYKGEGYEIYRYAFCKSTINSVVIPNGITTIADGAFMGSELTSITFPSSVTSVGKDAFISCTNNGYPNIKNVHITDIATWCNISFANEYSTPFYYGDCNLFLNNSLITDLVIPNGVTRISDYAFYNCGSLISVTISGTVKSIGSQAFYSCNRLKNVTLLDGVEEIGSMAFSFCPNLDNVMIPNSISKVVRYALDGSNSLVYNVKNGVNYLGNAQNPYLVAVNLKDTTITMLSFEPSTKVICGGGFCSTIISITIPNSVVYIGEYAFNSSGLESVSFEENSNLQEIGDGAFSGCSLKSIVIPNNCTTAGYGVFFGCNNLESITLNSALDFKHLFKNQVPNSLKTVVISGGTQIPYMMYYNCSSIETVVIPESVTKIGGSAFYGCSSLKQVIFEGNSQLEYIDGSAFENCTSLIEFVIPSNVAVIWSNAFYRCTNLTSVAFLSTEGWQAENLKISSIELADPSTAATYLKTTYSKSIWIRS